MNEHELSSESLYRYVFNHLSVLTDEELAEVDFEAGLAAIDDQVKPEEKRKLEKLFSLIQKELPIRHHGIKGMKWGVRRYQNKDGSLTPAGKQRAAEEAAKQSIFGTAKKYQVKTREGELITVEPVKPLSTGKKIVNALLGFSEKDEMGRRGDANYTLSNSKGETIGQLSLISKNPKTAYVDWITIGKDQRGKGYATDILNDALSKAKSSGYSKVELNALKDARPLYERIGFVYSDTSKMSIMDRIGGFEFGAKRMEFDLNNLKHSAIIGKRGDKTMSNYFIYNGELYHYGVKGMKWGVRRAARRDPKVRALKKQMKEDKRAENKAFQRAQGTYIGKKRVLGAYDKAIAAGKKADASKKAYKDAYKKTQQAIKDATYKKPEKPKLTGRQKVAKGAAVAAKAMVKLATLSMVDDIFYGGAGKKTIKAVGRKSVEAIIRARGGTPLGWID